MDATSIRIDMGSAVSLCANGTCPTVYGTNDETVVAVQGYRVTDSALSGLAVGEEVVLVDWALLEAVFGDVEH